MTPAAVGSRSVRGRLRLRAERDDAGRTVLMERAHAGAFHLSKSYFDGGVLMVQWVNPTAGVFAGDVLESDVLVGEGASLLVTTPSATRIHTRVSAEQPAGMQHQRFHVARGGWLEVQPEWLIPQRGSAFQQTTDIALDEGAGLFYAELLAPGRIAHGEALVFDELDLRLRLRVGGTLVIQERLRAATERTWPLRDARDEALFAGTVIVSHPGGAATMAAIARDCLGRLEGCPGGVSAISRDVVSCRLIARSSIPLRRALGSLRVALAGVLPQLRCGTRKL